MLSKCYNDKLIECGTDEAGRGCLAGPVTAAAIILPEDFELPLLNDSKKISEKIREKLKPLIIEQAISYSVTHIEPSIIDEINILNASILAMQESILKLNPEPEHIIVDGNRFKPLKKIPYTTIIKGDSKFMSIAAASVLAKTYRDAYMDKIHEEFPMYNWKQNKGYPTKEHREAIRKYGTTKYHRMTFRLLPEQFILDI
ncbi:ribonuclease HII [Flavobacterium sp.]|jgi:ribonuclease HII|uniref:ribonuclease HII n=1 Tax=Flavobacterium sp. TaxID=239 RepID=UPI002A8304FF|nr:ribonuclease HII [Flavobacterium sp.]